MKRTLVTLGMIMVLLISGIGSSMAQEKASEFTLIWGRAKNECQGNGICKLHLQIGKLEINYNWDRGATSGFTQGEFYIDESNNTFNMKLSEREFAQKAPEKLAEIKRDSQFYIDEDIPFPKDANAAFGLKRTTQIVLKKGIYDVKYQNGFYIITGKL
jgi:hypothetical protein